MRPIAILLMVTLAGCQTAPMDGTPGTGTTVQSHESSGATLTLDKTTYVPGGDVTMRFTNHTSQNLGYNPCANRTVERRQGSTWVLHPEPDRVCTMEIRFLAPGETGTAVTNVPADVTSGTWRMVLTFRSEPAGDVVRAISADFRVE